jgi:hypothetical protein
MARVWLLGACALAIGCGSEPAPSTAPASAAPAPPPATEQAPAVATALAALAIVPANGALVHAGQRRDLVPLVGAREVVVIDSDRRRRTFDPGSGHPVFDCDSYDVAYAAPLPLAAETTFTRRSISPPQLAPDPAQRRECLAEPLPLRAVHALGEPVLVECGHRWASYPFTCRVRDRTVTALDAMVASEGQVTSHDADAADGTIFVGAVATVYDPESPIVSAFVFGDGAEPQRAIVGRLGTGRAAESLSVHALSATEAAIDVFAHDEARGLRFRVGADARRIGEPEPVDRPAPPAIVVERPPGTDPHVRIRRGEATADVGGLDPAAATFAPSIARLGQAHVLVWSEGLRDTTRIRIARIDLDAGALAGPITEVSRPGREAGQASIDGDGERVVVAWEERVERGWEIRAATVR